MQDEQINSQSSFVYGCFPSYVSLYAANLLVRKHGLRPVAIFISTRPVHIRRRKIFGLSGNLFFLRNFGLRYSFYQWTLAVALPLLSIVRAKFRRHDGLLSFQQLAKMHHFSLIYSNDFNSDRRVLEFATEHNAKIFLSLGLDQILKAPFIEFFETACVNIHPAKLPDFRGPDPIFQFLLTAELTLGVTLHRIASEIDQGDIMLIDSIQRTADDTHLSLLRQYVEIGCLLFLRFLEKSQCAGIPQNNLPIRFPYKSWPTRCDIERFAANRYFLLGDLARALRIV